MAIVKRLSTRVLAPAALALMVSALLFSGTVQAREKVALVLGGGGARGISHIGVIRWLEEHRVPVDYVVGTSMGGLVGGVYAMGYPAEELRQLIDRIDWDDVLSATPPFRELSYRRKEDASDFPVKFEVGLRNGFSVPSGLNPGHFIDLLFQQLSAPYGSLESFDRLPIPFRCVAVDLESGHEVIFSEGQLWQALRATMAIPGVFTPAEVRGRTYVDGGILNNVPADVARQLGAAVVIAVDVGSPLKSSEELSSILGVADQTISIMMINNVRRIVQQADLIITPELEGVLTLDFQKSREIIDHGYAAAEQKRRFLATLSVSPSEWDEYLRDRSSRRRTAMPEVDSLTVSGVRDGAAEQVRAQVADLVPGTLQPEVLEDRLTRIYAVEKFNAVGYQVIEKDEGKGLDVVVEPADYGPPFVRFGLKVNGYDLDTIRFGMKARLTGMDWGFRPSETRIDLGLGDPNFAALEYYLPLAGGWFAAPRAAGVRRSVFFYEDNSRVAEYLFREAGLGFDLGYGFRQSTQELRAGFDVTDLKGSTRVGSAGLPELDGVISAARVRWNVNRLDDPVIPSSGMAARLNWDHYFTGPGLPEDLDQWSARVELFYPATKRNTLFGIVSGGATVDSDTPAYLDFTLGGPVRLGAYDIDQLRGSRALFGTTGLLHRIIDNSPFFGGATYVGTWYEVGSAYNRGDNPDYRHVGSAGLVLDSLVGPLFVGGSWGESSHFRLYFSIGTLFR